MKKIIFILFATVTNFSFASEWLFLGASDDKRLNFKEYLVDPSTKRVMQHMVAGPLARAWFLYHFHEPQEVDALGGKKTALSLTVVHEANCYLDTLKYEVRWRWWSGAFGSGDLIRTSGKDDREVYQEELTRVDHKKIFDFLCNENQSKAPVSTDSGKKPKK